ncbi:D-alanyl-D-alanine carboxypeptidase family protein [Fodinicola acaciae]|uniref:D-alanyl-D-alanine carboxypeptidase family protein n=1 Tax=Fodinicola acaciae TaxID=2681555 RepID=UPI0013D2BDDE|nr:D-alanyl-D-alanine carboxypeptidase [Fodinicola acaciae]
MTTRQPWLNRRRAILLLAALCCAVAAAYPWPATADTQPGPIGGAQLGTTNEVHAGSQPPSVGATAYVVADATTGKVVAANRAHWRNEPASILKTLLTLTIVRNVPLDKQVVVNAADLNVECTCVGLTAGRSYTVDSLLHALLMRSGNDVANVLATATGSRAKTLQMMNATAASLGAYDINALTPSGLNTPGQAVSAYDMALVLKAGLADPRFVRYFASTTYAFGPVGGPTRRLESQNELWHLGYAGTIGAKNGWTTPAGHTFVAAARRGERTLIVTMLNDNRPAGSDAAALLDWGFSVSPAAAGVGSLIPAPADVAAAQRARQAMIEAQNAAKANSMAGRPEQQTAPPAKPEGPNVTLQSGFSVGAIGLAGIALLPGRRPRRKARSR